MGKIKDVRRRERTKRRVKRLLIALLAFAIIWALWHLWNLHLGDLDKLHGMARLHHEDLNAITDLQGQVDALTAQNHSLLSTVQEQTNALQVKINGVPLQPTPAPHITPPHASLPPIPKMHTWAIIAGIGAVLGTLFKAVVPAL